MIENESTRVPTHYETLPHSSCLDPARCDCCCDACLEEKDPATLAMLAGRGYRVDASGGIWYADLFERQRAARIPDWRVPPGEILREALRNRGLTQRDLARVLRWPERGVGAIVNGQRRITPEIAIQLAPLTGIEDHVWNNLETRYRERLARAAARRLEP